MDHLGPDKPAASLSPSLLARKGQAQPAMGSRGFGGSGAMPGMQDDPGRDDRGADPAPVPAASLRPLTRQRDRLRRERVVPASAGFTIAPIASDRAAPEKRDIPKTYGKRLPRAAFTLRLDEERHLRLRLASALRNASAQTLMIEALDQFLRSVPEVEHLACQITTRTDF